MTVSTSHEAEKNEKGENSNKCTPVKWLRGTCRERANQMKITSNFNEPYWNAFWFTGDIRKKFFFFHILLHLEILFRPRSVAAVAALKRHLLSLTLEWVETKSGEQKKRRAFTMTFGWDIFSYFKTAQPVCRLLLWNQQHAIIYFISFHLNLFFLYSIWRVCFSLFWHN